MAYSSVAKIIKDILDGYRENRPVVIKNDGYIPSNLMSVLEELNNYLIPRLTIYQCL